MTGPWGDAVAAALAERRTAHALRVRRPVRVIDATHVEVDGRRLVNFASNDYLGLSHHSAVVAALASATSAGSGAAALVTGHTVAHAAAEATIAKWKGTESAVLVGSGFAANAAAIEAVAAVGEPVRFLVDKLAHASLIDAVRASGQPFRVYPHQGHDKLARLLAEAEPGQRQAIVTESIFSMDGDAADLATLAELRDRHGALLLLDEAHAAGVYGPAGGGLAAQLGVSADLTVVTLSKAAGVVGGAVCASADWASAVVNFGRPYVFSTSPPAAVADAITAAIGVMAAEPWRAARVRALAGRVRARLGMTGDSPIVPVVLGDEAAALAAAERLRDAGLLVVAVRPPTVPRGTSRLRVTLSCEHTDAEVDSMTAAVIALVDGHGVATLH